VTTVNDSTLDSDADIGNTGTHTYYTVITTPQNPMSEPWTEVLDYSCDWASGQSTASSATNEITEGLYDSGIDYTGSWQYGSIDSNFELTDFLADISSYNCHSNCADMARAVVTFSNAIGCNLTCSSYGRSPGDYIGEFDNCIDLIGGGEITNCPARPPEDPSIGDDCREGHFYWHAFARKTSNNTVWDATLRYDADATPDNVTDSEPPSTCGDTTTGYTWTLPINVSQSTFIDNLLDDWAKNEESKSPQYHNHSFNVE